jgi:uncharacterized protein (TIGR02996 family)
MLDHLLQGVVDEPQAEDRWAVLADYLEEHDDPRRAGWCSYDGEWGSAGQTKPAGQFQSNAWGCSTCTATSMPGVPTGLGLTTPSPLQIPRALLGGIPG